MLQIAVLNNKLAFAPQISPDMVAELYHEGFEQVICNRPDNEEAFQPTLDSIQAEAEKLGMSVIFAPVINSQFTAETIDKTRQALARDKKTLMFCRSGARCSILWAIIQTQNGKVLEETFRQLSPIGYDIAHLQDFILGISHTN